MRSNVYLLLPTSEGPPWSQESYVIGGWRVGQSKEGENRELLINWQCDTQVPLHTWEGSWSLTYYSYKFQVSLGRDDGNGTGG